MPQGGRRRAGTLGVSVIVAAAAAVCASWTGCRSEDPPAEAAPAPSTDEVWLSASCDLEQRLRETVATLAARGVVPVHGGEAYHWSFSCDGPSLAITVETVGATADGDPVIWLGAAGDPPRMVPVRLDVGAGQAELQRLLVDPGRPDPQTLTVDLATGVVWRP